MVESWIPLGCVWLRERNKIDGNKKEKVEIGEKKVISKIVWLKRIREEMKEYKVCA